MKERTQQFIVELTTILGVFAFILMFFFGLGYLLLHSSSEKQSMYNKCIDTCERIFQEQKLIECMQTCNTLDDKSSNVFSKPKDLNTSDSINK